MIKLIGIIPARFASTRFPGKPLVNIGGKTMIERVYTQALKSENLERVIVATDDNAIAECVRSFGGEVCLTSPDHPSGTDRCAEVVTAWNLSCDGIINIQGDEPFIDPNQIDLLCACFSDPRTELATLIKPIVSDDILFNPNAPKVIVDHEKFAIYFSRHPLPYIRGAEKKSWLYQHSYFQHIGIYGYRTDILRKITQLPPSSLEKAESLEQLRWVEHGFRIKTAVTTLETLAIDTPDDLARIVSSLDLNKEG